MDVTMQEVRGLDGIVLTLDKNISCKGIVWFVSISCSSPANIPMEGIEGICQGVVAPELHGHLHENEF